MLTYNRAKRCGQGFSLIEVLVVLVIMGILAAIVIPSLVASQPERNLAAASERFANDIRYCRAKAEATGNPIYLGFIFSPNEAQIDAGLDGAGDPIDPRANAGGSNNAFFDNPANPGVGRTCREYYIVEERPRAVRVDAKGKAEWSAEFNPALATVDGKTAVLRYIDWLNWYNAWNSSDTYANNQLMPYPKEPGFPYSRTQTSAMGVFPDPKAGAFNRVAVPLVAYPQYLINTAANYVDNFSNADATSLLSPVAGDWGAGDPLDQQFKMFCVADEQTILSWDDGLTEQGTGLRRFDDNSDYDMLGEEVKDYVLLKRVQLPKHSYFLNPWRSEWVVGWEGTGVNRRYVVKTAAFLQHLFQFSPSGEVALCDWTFQPRELADVGRNYQNSLVHGTVAVVDNMPTIRPVWMVLDECLDFGQPESYNYAGTISGSEISLLRNAKKANLTASARMFTLWPINGKFFVDDYTPNDSARRRDKDDALLDMSFYASGGGALSSGTPSGGELSAGAEEYGWAQDFLCSPGVADHLQR